MDRGDDLSARVRGIADMGDLRPGSPTLTTGLRGASEGVVEVRTLAEPRGSGSLGERLRSGPAVTVIGIDAPSVEHAASAVVPCARAELNLRFHPEQDPREARDPLVTHLESLRPSGIPLTVTPGDTGPGFEPATDGPAYRAALTALREGWGSEPALVAGDTAKAADSAEYAGPAKAADSAGGAA
ncbi:hypothetical protein [Streptomyces griseus]|uniref:hypothetical protein n=1 Tax=Streptomyces griseus TaxID=1911 RepID=UPI0033E1D9D0